MYPLKKRRIKKNLKDVVYTAIFNSIDSLIKRVPQYVKTGLFCAFVLAAIGFSMGIVNDNLIAGLIIGNSAGVAFGLSCGIASSQHCRLRLKLITGVIISGITAAILFLTGFGLLACLICPLILAIIFILGCGLGALIGPLD